MTYYIFTVISHRKLKKFHDRATNGETNIGSYIDDTSSIGTAAAHYINDTLAHNELSFSVLISLSMEM